MTGSRIIPDCERFTRSTSTTWSSIDRLRWMMPMPPARARAMARRASVTVSIAADTIGMASSMRGVSRVQVRTSFGMTDDSAGTSSTSSKVRPCLANFGGYAPGPSASSVNGVGAASIGGPFVSGPFSDPTGGVQPYPAHAVS